MNKKLVTILVVLNLGVIIVAVFLVGALLGFGAQRNALNSVEAAIKEKWSAKPPQFVTEHPLVTAGVSSQVERSKEKPRQPELIQPPLPLSDRAASLDRRAGLAAEAINPGGRDLVYIEALSRLSHSAEEWQTEAEEKLIDTLENNKEFHNMKTDRAMDRFNRVYVPETGRSETLVARLEQLVGDSSISEQITKTAQIDQTYVRSVNLLAGERQNQSRTIRVRRGDTLFRIARRAYGDGDQYPRIYKANPLLRNPNLIAIGDILRVPK